MKLVAAIIVFIIEAVLSHTPGDRSGEESRWLSEKSGVDEGLLRRGAHTVLFLILTAVFALSFGGCGVFAAAIWSLLDEATKPLIPGRHFSWFDVGLNLIGVVIGSLTLVFG